MYYELFDRLDDAIHREKQLKKWHRDWKEKIICDFNPVWKDLTESIGVDEEFIEAVKEAYEYGIYDAGDRGAEPVMREDGLDCDDYRPELYDMGQATGQVTGQATG